MKYRGMIMWLHRIKDELERQEQYAMADVIDDAISVTKLHSPEMPVTEMLESGEFVVSCPTCEAELEGDEVMCGVCTQVIDWGDDDEE